MHVSMFIHLDKAGMIKCIFSVLLTILLCIQQQHDILGHKSIIANAACFLKRRCFLKERKTKEDRQNVHEYITIR